MISTPQYSILFFNFLLRLYIFSYLSFLYKLLNLLYSSKFIIIFFLWKNKTDSSLLHFYILIRHLKFNIVWEGKNAASPHVWIIISFFLILFSFLPVLFSQKKSMRASVLRNESESRRTTLNHPIPLTSLQLVNVQKMDIKIYNSFKYYFS